MLRQLPHDGPHKATQAYAPVAREVKARHAASLPRWRDRKEERPLMHSGRFVRPRSVATLPRDIYNDLPHLPH